MNAIDTQHKYIKQSIKLDVERLHSLYMKYCNMDEKDDVIGSIYIFVLNSS